MGYLEDPQGIDCVQKTWITTKIGLVVGVAGSLYKEIQPKSGVIMLQRVASSAVMMATMGAIFGVTTCISAELRDDPHGPLNFFLGGCASGVFLGAKTHSISTGTSSCLGLGAVAYLTKAGNVEGWRVWGAPRV
ncbi:NADH dehydrogenase [ubiquinone] 1 alpha subcomplex subunit 11 [Nematolebias whitei]|uniref:NADH dehydrogenase [ubiquinone] 1 alpha subcomplex subunit 11 n=1 Tax=Nematolebias whitei TaxID=451745 RepID=UPI0018985198|nr:NADH dehydrogenase [ubiquinone] 1 alpha subcomplex subunit 11 [Nematolebias whitei]